MSKVKLYTTLVILILSGQGSLLLAQETPVSGGEGGASSSSSGTYTGLVETTYDDPNWALVISDLILREDLCYEQWYDKVFNPCYTVNRYWKLESCAEPGQAFPMSAIKSGINTLDSLYVRQGFGFQLYYNSVEPNDPNDLDPASPWMVGPKYVTLTCWRDYPAPDGFEPGTFFVTGVAGDLENYSIVIYPNPLRLSKVDDVNDANCVYPWNFIDDNYLTYQICYENYSGPNTICPPQDANNVIITDSLPIEVDFYSASDGGVYDPNTRKVTWNIGNLSPTDSNCVQLTVKVNEFARPGGVITNKAQIEGDEYLTPATQDTNVCFWGSEIIYVDKDANDPNSFNNGTSWDDAYTDLRDAFTGAQNLGADITAIWVAAGTYEPVKDINVPGYWEKSFELPENVGLFGHFGGIGTYETSTSQRNFADANNETILEGQIGDNYYDAVYYVVYADNIDDAIVDGFTVQGAYGGYDGSGIYLNASDVSIVNCKLKENRNCGIEITNYSYPDIHNCTFIDNTARGLTGFYGGDLIISNCIFDGNDTTRYGIYHSNLSVVVVDDCLFKDHTSFGLYGGNGTLTLTDSTFDNERYGLYISDVNTDITNSSIKSSGYYGVYCSNSDLTVDHSVIANSVYEGLYMDSGCKLTLKNSVVRYSGYEGLELRNNLTTILTNNWIHNNGTDQVASRASGIYFYNQVGIPLIRNNTIYDNFTYGIESSESGTDPNILNCIIWGNTSGDLGGTFNDVNYCSLQTSRGTDNITGDPGFKNIETDPNDLHIDETSQCKDAGDPNGSYGDETDIDGEGRIKYGRVDIGADEYYWSPADFDRSEYVDFEDYAKFAGSWQTDDPNISLDDDNDVDYNDLALFCKDWLWEVGWGDSQWIMSMGVGGTGFGLESMSLMESSLSLDSYETTSTAKRGDALMLSAAESLRTRPERLRAKSQKFYDIIPANTVSALRRAEEAKRQRIDEAKDTKDILEWLDEIWINGDIDWTEERYLEFRKSIEESEF